MIGLTVDARMAVIRAPQTESRISHGLRSLKSVYDKEDVWMGGGKGKKEAKNKPPLHLAAIEDQG